jgi:hypothetical protein
MRVAIMVNRESSLRKALATLGSSQGAYYYRARRSPRSDRGRLRDPSMTAAIKELELRKPMYGTTMTPPLPRGSSGDR